MYMKSLVLFLLWFFHNEVYANVNTWDSNRRGWTNLMILTHEGNLFNMEQEMGNGTWGTSLVLNIKNIMMTI